MGIGVWVTYLHSRKIVLGGGAFIFARGISNEDFKIGFWALYQFEFQIEHKQVPSLSPMGTTSKIMEIWMRS
jgi:hypothetical protein